MVFQNTLTAISLSFYLDKTVHILIFWSKIDFNEIDWRTTWLWWNVFHVASHVKCQHLHIYWIWISLAVFHFEFCGPKIRDGTLTGSRRTRSMPTSPPGGTSEKFRKYFFSSKNATVVAWRGEKKYQSLPPAETKWKLPRLFTWQVSEKKKCFNGRLPLFFFLLFSSSLV